MSLVRWAISLAAAASLGALNSAPAQQDGEPPAEGVYLLKFKGTGREVKLSDGSDAVLGARLSPSVGVGGTLKSCSNDNTRFTVTINKLGPLPVRVHGPKADVHY